MIKTLVVGAAGRMGRAIVSCIEDAAGIEVRAGTEMADSPALGADIGELAGLGKKNIALRAQLDECMAVCDVGIDFSTPESSMRTFHAAFQRKKALVVGTTGFSASQKEEIERMTREIPCVLAPNMSIGVNVLFKVIRDVARTLGDAYDVEIVEAHHRFKKDAPSGTAARLAEIVAEALDRDLESVGVYGRKGMTEGRGPKEIGIHSLRAGDIVGEHRVMFGGMGETLEIVHRAQSRDTFARGAVTAAQWIVKQPPGLYDMQDVLGLRE